jgi:energy-coupling factor transport system ATP-binding protein
LARILSGLLRPSSGEIRVNGRVVAGRWNRGHVGLVFQQPEDQFFSATVLDEVYFGTRHIGVSREEAANRVGAAIQRVGLDIAEIGSRSPFQLSDGQKRLVAIACVLATRPTMLILDEPTVGLDALARHIVLNQIRELHTKEGMGILVISHYFDEILPLVDRIWLIVGGSLAFDGSSRELLRAVEGNTLTWPEMPELTRLMLLLRQRGFNVPLEVYGVHDAMHAIKGVVFSGEHRKC